MVRALGRAVGHPTRSLLDFTDALDHFSQFLGIGIDISAELGSIEKLYRAARGADDLANLFIIGGLADRITQFGHDVIRRVCRHKNA